MQVRFLEGRRAGELAILPFHVARPLIEARRVEAVDKFVAERLLGKQAVENSEASTVSAERQPPIAAPLKGRGKRVANK